MTEAGIHGIAHLWWPAQEQARDPFSMRASEWDKRTWTLIVF